MGQTDRPKDTDQTARPLGVETTSTELPDPGEGTAARAEALRALAAILRSRRTLDALLEEINRSDTLTQQDRGFVRQLLATALRRLGQIDNLIDQMLERPLPRGAETVRDILRLGIAQILFLKVPDHAAVAEALHMAEASGHPRMKGLINAILRRVTREGSERASMQDAARYNTPDWLWASWSAEYGEETTRAIADAHQAEPALDLTVNGDAELWATRLGATAVPTGSLRRPNARVEGLPGYDEGAWWVQDAAAALPVKLLGDVTGLSVIDLCAAPGGKTAQLAAAGAVVTAVDRSAARLARLERNMRRLSLSVTAIASEASQWRPDHPADIVLVDPPCSATGTIRRHPDIPWTKSTTDIRRLTNLQTQLLDAAAAMVKPGGILLYCTCSLQPEESLDQIETLLNRNTGLARIPISAGEVGGISDFVTAEGDLRTLPCHMQEHGGLDGFYAARLRKNS